MDKANKGPNGFTIVEMLVALCLSAIVAAAIYKSFGAQQKIYTVQDQAVEMQQNLRAALDMMNKEIRMAGCDPLGTSGATIISATANSLHFTMDITGGESDGIDNNHNLTTDEPGERANGNCNGPNEDITYSIYADANGIPTLWRRTLADASDQPVAQNTTNLEFFYTLDTGPATTTPADPTAIRSVQITVLARSALRDKDYIDKNVYSTPSGANWGPYNDGYRRRLTTVTARCRNMGYK